MHEIIAGISLIFTKFIIEIKPMPLKKSIFLILLYYNAISLMPLYAQKKAGLTLQKGKTFISRNMEDLEILTDSTLTTSLIDRNSELAYKLKDDTLSIREKFYLPGLSNKKLDTVMCHDYKIISLSSDTIILRNNSHGKFNFNNAHDTLYFINIKRLKGSGNEFKYLEVNYANSFGGGVDVSIDSAGKVRYLKSPTVFDDKGRNLSLKIRYLSKSEFQNFKEILSKSSITTLPVSRGCPIDGGQSNFKVIIGDKIYKSRCCFLDEGGQALLDNLLNISQ
jgi:hypothetical protein